MDVGKSFQRAAVFGAGGAIGKALSRALAQRGVAVWAGSRAPVPQFEGEGAIRQFRFDLEEEATLVAVAEAMKATPPDLVLVTTGVLTLPDGTGPERSHRAIDAQAMAAVFRLNTIGPALIAKHMLPLLPRKEHSVFAALSARVGSIGDNRLGGWHSYRASKAALNMLLQNFAVELARTHPQAVVAGLHPGTVDSALSAPFQANLPAGQLHEPEQTAQHLLTVIDGLTPSDSGGVFDWKGERVPA